VPSSTTTKGSLRIPLQLAAPRSREEKERLALVLPPSRETERRITILPSPSPPVEIADRPVAVTDDEPPGNGVARPSSLALVHLIINFAGRRAADEPRTRERSESALAETPGAINHAADRARTPAADIILRFRRSPSPIRHFVKPRDALDRTRSPTDQRETQGEEGEAYQAARGFRERPRNAGANKSRRKGESERDL